MVLILSSTIMFAVLGLSFGLLAGVAGTALHLLSWVAQAVLAAPGEPKGVHCSHLAPKPGPPH